MTALERAARRAQPPAADAVRAKVALAAALGPAARLAHLGRAAEPCPASAVDFRSSLASKS
jgi:hypothetical protein